MRTVIKLTLCVLMLIAIYPRIALAGNDVVVDGETKVFYPDDVIDNLTVINGGVADLKIGARVNGNLTVEAEGSYAGSGGCSVVGDVMVKDGGRISMWFSTIGGNLQGDGAGHINFLISEVVGNIQLTGGADFNGYYGGTLGGDFKYEKGSAVWLRAWTVGGNVQVSDNEGRDIFIDNCQIGADLQVFCNWMGRSWWTQYPIDIKYNTVGGNLQVKENVCTPPPRVIDNDVEGNVEVD